MKLMIEVAVAFILSLGQFDVPPDALPPNAVTVLDMPALAQYDPRNNLILVAEEFHKEPYTHRQAIIVHEMAHWAQVWSGSADGQRLCDLEREAYAVMDAYGDGLGVSYVFPYPRYGMDCEKNGTIYHARPRGP